jgi:argininosuccinate synthase
MAKKIVLAYSGGLDTSFCIKYLTEEKGYEIHALTVDTGGFSEEEIKEMEARALALGASSYQREDVTEAYYRECLRYLVYGNCLRYQTYPMSVSAERMFQAMSTARYAVEIEADGVAHGSTGAGNDQVRFDLAFELSGRELEIITPIRDMQLSRQEEVDYLAKHGLQWPEKKGTYSINAGLWGTTVGGAETLTSHQSLPEAAWPVPVTETDAREIDLHFSAGEFRGFDDQEFASSVAAIRALEALAAPLASGATSTSGTPSSGSRGGWVLPPRPRCSSSKATTCWKSTPWASGSCSGRSNWPTGTA